MSTPRTPSRRIRSLLPKLVIALGLPFLVLEVITRVKTTSGANGLPAIQLQGMGWSPLVPYRPADWAIEHWLPLVGKAQFKHPHPELGWSLLPSRRSRPTRDPRGRELIYETNPNGFRGDPSRTYAPDPPPGVVRVEVLGDSFTFGADVELEDSWAHKLERRSERLEVLNLGVTGYGMDQAFLRWRLEGKPYSPHAVLMMVWPENVLRNLNLVRYYLSPRTGFLMNKPRFVLAEGGELTLVNHPVMTRHDVAAFLEDPFASPLAPYDHFLLPDEVEESPLYASRLYRVVRSLAATRARYEERHRLYSGEDPTALDLAEAIALAWRDEVTAAGSRPILVVLPQEDLMEEAAKGELPLVKRFRDAGLEVVDLFPAFEGRTNELFYHHAHFTPAGCTVVADVLYEVLRPLFPELGGT